VLCLAAHCDDIEIGCGGTILAMARANPAMEFKWISFSGNSERQAEQRNGLKHFTRGCEAEIECHGFNDGLFTTQLTQIKSVFESSKSFDPDLVLTHTRFDRHQDHRAISDLTWNTFRSHLILEYEVPKWDGETIDTNCYFTLSDVQLGEKINSIRDIYVSQSHKHWFDEELFRSKARLRGIECNARYAEAFVARKLLVA
jgi:LmbE family N-acetylglucosaminyl deacetylase